MTAPLPELLGETSSSSLNTESVGHEQSVSQSHSVLNKRTDWCAADEIFNWCECFKIFVVPKFLKFLLLFMHLFIWSNCHIFWAWFQHTKHTTSKHKYIYFVLPEAFPASCVVRSTGGKKVILKPSWSSGTDCNNSNHVGRKDRMRQIKKKKMHQSWRVMQVPERWNTCKEFCWSLCVCLNPPAVFRTAWRRWC